MSVEQLENLDPDTLRYAAHWAHLRAANIHTEIHKTNMRLAVTPIDEAPEVAVSLAKKIGAYKTLESLANTLRTMAADIEQNDSEVYEAEFWECLAGYIKAKNRAVRMGQLKYMLYAAENLLDSENGESDE